MAGCELGPGRAGRGHDAAAGRWKAPGIKGWAWAATSQYEQAAEIDCSRHIGKRRAGKYSDPIDAVRAASRSHARRPHRCALTGTARRCGC